MKEARGPMRKPVKQCVKLQSIAPFVNKVRETNVFHGWKMSNPSTFPDDSINVK